MGQAATAGLSPFGEELRMWRKRRGLSQLALAMMAQTTPRYVSFIETGRSRPGRDVVMRLAHCMDLPVRDQNRLLVAAGLRPAYAEIDLDAEQTRPFRAAIEAILTRHDPYPACAMDPLGSILMSNAGFQAFSPGLENLTPEESVDSFFQPGAMQDAIENWAELAWAWVDRNRQEAARTNNTRLAALVDRAVAHLAGVPRPLSNPGDSPHVLCPRFRVGDRTIRTFVTVMRFEGVQEVTLSEIRIELVFPMDDDGDRFFRELSQRS